MKKSSANSNKEVIIDSLLGGLPEGTAQELDKIKIEKILRKWGK